MNEKDRVHMNETDSFDTYTLYEQQLFHLSQNYLLQHQNYANKDKQDYCKAERIKHHCQKAVNSLH